MRTYIAIDLKSFYASVECVERKLDPMTTNLVVADESRTEKTICLAVSPSLKEFGIPGRPRLFEVIQKVKDINARRPKTDPVTFLIAPPRMQTYMDYSTRIYNVYLRFFSPDDIHVYSIDEVLIDATDYLDLYRMTGRQLAAKLIREVYAATGITATGGIGTNLYLAKVAMDIMAKHVTADADGVRIAELDELSYRKDLWAHTPLTDFWRVGRGTAKKLEEVGIFTMGDIARCSISKDYYRNEDLLYKIFGVNAELLIDHAWGYEPVTMAEIKQYKPESSSTGSGQVLHCAYSFADARLVMREMADMLSLDLVDKGLVTDQIVLTVGYDRDSLADGRYKGNVTTDRYGRKVPKSAHGTINLDQYSSSTKMIMDKATELYDRIVDEKLLVRRIYVTANHVVKESEVSGREHFQQMDLFTDYEKLEAEREAREAELAREKQLQQAMLSIKKKFGKNAILKGMNLQKNATAKDKNSQIGGHRA